MKVFSIKFMLLAQFIFFVIFSFNSNLAEAEYLIAQHKEAYTETIYVDTSSIYEESNKRFNVIVYDVVIKGQQENKVANTYKFKFDENRNEWQILIINSNNEKVWVQVESNSLAQDVLKICLPYLK